jgi:dephospho-CoA kinase
VIVEFFGPSGSGKSHLVPGLAAEHRLPVIRVGFGQTHALALLFALTHPRLTWRLLRLWNRKTREDSTLRGKKLYRLISFLAKEQKARLLRGGVIDEGLLQYFLILHERRIVPAEIEECLTLLPASGYLVCIVESDRETRVRRMQARGKVSRGALGEDYQKRWQDTLEENAAALSALLKARFTCRVMRND